MIIEDYPALPEWLTGELPPVQHSELKWQPARGNSYKPSKAPMLKRFASSLLAGEFVDTKTIKLPGATITLPNGMALYRRFRNLVESRYEQNGLSPYGYPSLLPLCVFDQTNQMFSLDNLLFKVGTDRDFKDNRPQAALSPTGEAAIYSHWHKTVRQSSDLPIELYREASYFRPKGRSVSSGNSIFRALESTGVYEFHGCYENSRQAAPQAEKFSSMLKAICEQIKLPVLWSIRPRWTNNSAVALATLAADLPLPMGKTLQVAALYDQAESFSQRYKIQYNRLGQRVYTYNLSGFCSKRLPTSHLLWSMTDQGMLACAPAQAVYQVGLIAKNAEEVDVKAMEALLDNLRGDAVRTLPRSKLSSKRISEAVSCCQRQGVPLSIVINCHVNEGYTCTFTRTDKNQESRITIAMLDQLRPTIKAVLRELNDNWYRRVVVETRAMIVRAKDMSEVKTALGKGKIAICPLRAEESATHELESAIPGEIIGFAQQQQPEDCVINQIPVTTLSLVARRI